MSWVGPFQNEQEFLAAYRGDLGDEAEQWADELVDEGLVDIHDDADSGSEEAPSNAQDQWVGGMEAQLSRFEKNLGRKLTRKEFAGIVDDAKAFDQVPDLWEQHGEKLQGREMDPELMAEEFQDAKAAAEEAEQG